MYLNTIVTLVVLAAVFKPTRSSSDHIRSEISTPLLDGVPDEVRTRLEEIVLKDFQEMQEQRQQEAELLKKVKAFERRKELEEEELETESYARFTSRRYRRSGDVRLCGKKLIDMMKKVCNSCLKPGSGDISGACCENQCSMEKLKSYCC